MGLVLTACGGGQDAAGKLLADTAVPALSDTTVTETPVTETAASITTADDFTLYVSPSTFLSAESQARFALDVDERIAEEEQTEPDSIEVTISAADAIDLRALYCELRYDPEQYSPAGVEHLDWVDGDTDPAAGGDMLTLEVTSEPGVVHLGQVLANWDERAGLSGGAELARVRFVREPCAVADLARSASSALTSDAVRPELVVDISNEQFRWDYNYPGDYDQNGLVGVSDLTPLGAHLGEHGEDAIWEWDAEERRYISLGPGFAAGSPGAVIDVNRDSWITVSDITAIGMHFSEGVTSFNLYQSLYPDLDMPISSGGANLVESVGSFAYRDALKTVDPRHFFLSAPLIELHSGMGYWLRPVFNGQEGTPSNFARYYSLAQTGIALDVQPDTYLEGAALGGARVDVTYGADGLMADVYLTGAENLRYFAGELHYSSSLFALDYGLTTNGELHRPPAFSGSYGGLPHSAETIPFYSSLKPAYSGEGYLARLVFKQQPDTSCITPHLPSQFLHANLLCPWFTGGTVKKLRWYYQNTGDTNQDGGVWVDDFIAIERFFNSYVPYHDSWDDEPWIYVESIESVADVNNNGLVTVNDVTELGMNLGSTITGYYIYMGDDPAAEPGPEPIGYVSFTEAIGDPFGERLRFEFQVANPVEGQQLWVRPELNGEIGALYEDFAVLIDD
ncbi:hypothetical protein JW859_10915 [bacterium]|nr:hypothetical protein [bacterium]